MVAAVVAGDADGIAEAYDRYAASLYAYCSSMLPRPDAAEVVQDTFVIAVSRLDGLREPDRLDAWLHAVARNECLRRLGPESREGREGRGELAGGATAAAWAAGSSDPDELPAVTLPTELRGRVLTTCADNSPTGRAYRVSVTHRAGPFGPSGFPKAIGPAGPRWWQRVRRHPRAAAVVAVLAALAAAAGITMIMTASGSTPRTSALAVSGGLGAASSTVTPGSASAASSPTHKATPSVRPSTPSATTPASVPSPVSPSMMVTVTKPKPSPSRTSPSASPSPSPSPSTSPAQGYLLAASTRLVLTSTKGKAVSGSFVLTAVGGPVNRYTVRVPAAVAGKVTVAPVQGSLPANGSVTVTVTAASTVALNTNVTVRPGDLTVRVMVKIKA